ncbi:MAG: hypothetical protein KDG44_02880 [Burkholderiaceae bacterium]|nr:hypothetical protein [Burkholderiaceae bacterium]
MEQAGDGSRAGVRVARLPSNQREVPGSLRRLPSHLMRRKVATVMRWKIRRHERPSLSIRSMQVRDARDRPRPCRRTCGRMHRRVTTEEAWQ